MFCVNRQKFYKAGLLWVCSLKECSRTCIQACRFGILFKLESHFVAFKTLYVTNILTRNQIEIIMKTKKENKPYSDQLFKAWTNKSIFLM